MNAVENNDMSQSYSISDLANAGGFGVNQGGVTLAQKGPEANVAEQAGAQVAEMSIFSFGMGALTGGSTLAFDALNLINNAEIGAAIIDTGRDGSAHQNNGHVTVEGAQVSSFTPSAEVNYWSMDDLYKRQSNDIVMTKPSRPSMESPKSATGFDLKMRSANSSLEVSYGKPQVYDLTKMSNLEKKAYGQDLSAYPKFGRTA